MTPPVQHRKYKAYTRNKVAIYVSAESLFNADDNAQEWSDWWDAIKERMTSGGVDTTSNWALNKMLWIWSFANCLARTLFISLSSRATNWPKSSSDSTAESLVIRDCDKWLELFLLLILQCSDVADKRFLPRRICTGEPDTLCVELVSVSDSLIFVTSCQHTVIVNQKSEYLLPNRTAGFLLLSSSVKLHIFLSSVHRHRQDFLWGGGSALLLDVILNTPAPTALLATPMAQFNSCSCSLSSHPRKLKYCLLSAYDKGGRVQPDHNLCYMSLVWICN